MSGVRTHSGRTTPSRGLTDHNRTGALPTTGNQALARMVTGEQKLARFSDALVRSRADQVKDWIEAKKQVRAHELSEQSKTRTQEENFAIASGEVEQAWAHLLKIEAGELISVDDWVVMKNGLSSEEYARALRGWQAWKGKPDDKEKFLKDLPADKLYLFQDAVARRTPSDAEKGKSLDDQTASTGNPERAKQAHTELDAIKAGSDIAKQRLTDGLIELLVWGVAEARNSAAGATPGAAEGILGIDQAVRAAQALVAMSQPEYLDVFTQLGITGGAGKESDWNQRRTESALILKAVAARLEQYQAKDARARTTVGGFSDAIRGEDTTKLNDQTSMRDTGSGGLQQRFTMTCQPTTIQILTAEGDPVYSLDLATDGKHGLGFAGSSTADAQKTMLNKSVAPRALIDRWKAFKATLGTLTGLTQDQKEGWQALLDDLVGKPVDATKLGTGRALAVAAGYTAQELADFKTYFNGLQQEPGLSFNECEALVNSLPEAAKRGATRHDFAKGAIADGDLDTVWARLFRGNDVAIIVLWNGGGGHAMSLTDGKGTPPKGGASRTFLLTDPWAGNDQWLSAADVKSGTFGTAGAGYIATMFY